MSKRTSPTVEKDGRVTHRLWPELGEGTVIELTHPLNGARQRFRAAKVLWDNYGRGRPMTYDIGSLRPVP